MTRLYNLKGRKRIVELRSIVRRRGSYKRGYMHGRTIQGNPQQSREAKNTKAQRRTEEGV